MTATMEPRRFPVRRNKGVLPELPAESVDEVINFVNALWTDADVMKLFRISYPTCIVWRRKGLPFHSIQGDQRPTIRYIPSEVVKWGKANRKEMFLSSVRKE